MTEGGKGDAGSLPERDFNFDKNSKARPHPRHIHSILFCFLAFCCDALSVLAPLCLLAELIAATRMNLWLSITRACVCVYFDRISLAPKVRCLSYSKVSRGRRLKKV